MKKYYYKLSTVKIREFVIKSHQYVYTKAHSICAFVQLHLCSTRVHEKQPETLTEATNKSPIFSLVSHSATRDDSAIWNMVWH